MIYTFRFRFAVLMAATYMFVLCGPVVFAQTHEIKQEIMDAFGWFGGDDTPDNPRNVGVGQSVRIDKSMTIESFSFHFAAPFDYAMRPENKGHEVTLVLHVRNDAGAVLATSSVTLPASFTSGWVTWDGLMQPAVAGSNMIFTAYLVGGYDVNPFTSSHSAALNDPYPDGTRYTRHADTDEKMADWDEWNTHPWDSAFRLTGTLMTTGISDGRTPDEPRIHLAQSYPNPVSTNVVFEYVLTQPGHIRLELYNMLGVRLHTITDAVMRAGSHRKSWSGVSLPNGLYTVVLRAGGETAYQLLRVLR